jgi:hypothetical protein
VPESVGLVSEVEHARVGGQGGKGGCSVISSDSTQFSQQDVEAYRVVEADVLSGVAGKQGSHLIIRPDLT